MKSKIKRCSHSALSAILAVCMLFSCMTVGLMATDAAQVDSEAAVGAELNDSNSKADSASLDDDTSEDVGTAADNEAVGADADDSVGTVSDVYYKLCNADGTAIKEVRMTSAGVPVDFEIPSTSTYYRLRVDVCDNGTWTYFYQDANNTSDFNVSEYMWFKKDRGSYFGVKGKFPYKNVSLYYQSYNGSQIQIHMEEKASKVNVSLSSIANATATITQGDTTISEGSSKALDQGKEATLTLTPDTGYIPQKAIINGTQYNFTKSGSKYIYKFNVPSTDTTVSATLKYVVTYSVTTLASTDGSLSVDKTSGEQGETITVTATPKRGKVLSSISVVDKNGSPVSVTPDYSNNRATFNLPASDVRVSATFSDATSYTITGAQVTTGNGSYTLKLTDASGNVLESHTADTHEGVTMTAYTGEKLVITASPSAGYQLDTIYANGDERTSGYETTIGSDITDISATFKKNTAKNQYIATLGSGTDSTYNKVKATFFDYYTNGEFNDGWIGGIKDGERAIRTGYCAPYNQLNTALKAYASSNSLAYPLYFGNFYPTSSATSDGTVNYNYNQYANNSNYLDGQNKAVPGLTGKTLSSNGLPNYFKSGVTNDNGPEMKFFNRDWLSNASENGQGELASIIDSPFPMNAKTIDTSGGSHTYYEFDSANQNLWFENFYPIPEKIYLDISNTRWWTNDSAKIMAHLWTTTSDYIDVEMTHESGNIYSVNTSGKTYVIFYRKVGSSWFNKTGDLSIPSKKDKCIIIDSDSNTSWGTYSGTISLSTPTPTVNYSTSASDAVYSPEYNNRGIYPFDRSHKGGQAWDLGFGVSMEIKFTLGPEGQTDDGADQKFEFTGDDDLWVFVDDHLVLDLGGAHKQTEGSINFHTLTVSAPATYSIGNGAVRNQKFGEWSSSTGSSVGAGEDYWFDTTKSAHTMKIFYLERGMYDSNLKFGFSMYPQPDEYDVEKVVDVDTNGLNAGLKKQYSDTFTFKNTSADGMGSEVDYEVFNSADNQKPSPSEDGTTSDFREFSLNIPTNSSGNPINKYATFKKEFTVGQNLRTEETLSGYYQYDTSYKVVDVENSNAIVKAGDGRDTGNFKYKTTLAGADPDIDPTHLKTQFTNVLKTGSFMVTKDIIGFDDTDTAFPFIVSLKMSKGVGSADIDFNTEGLVYRSSLDNFATTHTLGAGGKGYVHEYEYILFEGIPLGAKVTVSEPAVGSKYTVNGVGDVNCYKMVTIDNNQAVSGNETIYNRKSSDTSSELYNQYLDVTFGLLNFDTVTITNEPKNYRLDYKFTTRLYGDKIYKMEGFMTPDMVHAGYVLVNNSTHNVSITQQFVSENIPYESNFMKNITWASDNYNNSLSMDGVDDYGILESTSSDKTLIVKIDTNGNGFYDKTITGLRCGESVMDGGSYVSGTKEGDTPSYWDIYKMDEDTGNKGSFVTRCYSTDFMYVAYDNYFVSAVYGAGVNSELYNTFTDAVSVDLGVTRNHWNDTVTGVDDNNGAYDLADHEYDRLYLDISLAYNVQGIKINSPETTGITTGYEIVILDGITVSRVVRNVVINKSELDNKNRVHAYYGFANSPANRGYKLGIRAYLTYQGTTTYSEVMPFELKTIGSKPASGQYDLSNL